MKNLTQCSASRTQAYSACKLTLLMPPQKVTLLAVEEPVNE